MADRISPGRRFSSPAARERLGLSRQITIRRFPATRRWSGFQHRPCSGPICAQFERDDSNQDHRLWSLDAGPLHERRLWLRDIHDPQPSRSHDRLFRFARRLHGDRGVRRRRSCARTGADHHGPRPRPHLPRHQLRGQHGHAIGSLEPMIPGRSAERRRESRSSSPIQRADRRFRAAPRATGARFRGTIFSGAWSGTIAGIPAGGPYFVSVRAANGTAYATLPSVVKVGLVFDLWGEGQAAAIIGRREWRVGKFDLYGPLGRELAKHRQFLFL